MFEIASTVLAITILLAVACPTLFAIGEGRKNKRVGSSYWGTYEGTEPQDSKTAGTVEVPKPARKHHIVAGSESYVKSGTRK